MTMMNSSSPNPSMDPGSLDNGVFIASRFRSQGKTKAFVKHEQFSIGGMQQGSNNNTNPRGSPVTPKRYGGNAKDSNVVASPPPKKFLIDRIIE
jgi:hypothetical protein